MYLIHGTWIPDSPQDFIQSGGFYLWVETDADAPPPASRGRSESAAAGQHPRHLARPQLEAFFGQALHLRLPRDGDLFCTRSFLLPSAGGAPLPSAEILPYVEMLFPEETELAWWQVCCYRVPHLIASLNNLQFVALHEAENFQLGIDLQFWYRVSQTLRGIIARDQYIPALKYRLTTPSKGAKRSKRPPAELYPAWEILSDDLEAALTRYSACMPAVGAAGAVEPAGLTLFEPASLLRHFSECLLFSVVAHTPVTQKMDQEIDETLLFDCLHPTADGETPAPSPAAAITLDTYAQWAAWREKLAAAHTAGRFTVCLRLEEALSTDVDDWQMHFLVAAKDDPSFQLPLASYWRQTDAAKAEVRRRFGPDFEKTLLLALGAAARIYPPIWDGLDSVEPGGFRLSLDEAFAFLKEHAWVLEDAGYTVLVPAWWTPAGRRRAKVRLRTSTYKKKSAAVNTPGRFSLDTLVSYDYQLAIAGEVVTEAEWRRLVESKTPLVQFRGQWMELDKERMQHLLAFWQTHQKEQSDLTVLDVMKLATESQDDLEWDHGQELAEMLDRLNDKSALAIPDDLPDLHGTLRAYQKRGLAWLSYLESLGLNGCLADDMGLGKTVQVIARLVEERAVAEDAQPTLLVAPTSVLGNWQKEIARFAPHLRTLMHQGAARPKDEKTFGPVCSQYDVVITSFALARLDEKLLRSVTWQRVVVDEAQNIKNPLSAQARAIAKLKARHRLALTGTPVENRLLDLWSILNFLHPGYLGTATQFRRSFETPIQREHDVGRSLTLKRIVEPFILRRVKTDKSIIDDLPDKVEQKLYCNLTAEQASLYEAVVRDATAQLEGTDGIQRRGVMLATLLKLKQVCNHPAQFLQDGSPFTSERSYKVQRLQEMLEEVIANGESALVFTQFTEIGGALHTYLTRSLHYTTYYLHGGTSAPQRERLVTAFQEPEGGPAVFILSLRAGGVGLNLTRASHVFHLDRWWNPAVEDQATDRAFRIGQTKNVQVHKFVTVGTLEEHIDELIEDKKRLSSGIIGADESWLTELDNETFRELITLQRSAVLD